MSTVPAAPLLIGACREFTQVLEHCRRVAPTRSTVLISGETGTGKEQIARVIHACSPRAERQMVVFYCAGIPETLLESELFGHEKGAFTGALSARSGLFERAHQSTILLDEVGDIPLAAQAKLLRVLQEARVTRLGGTETHECDVRVIATTNRDLRALVQRGQFREDLFYRLNVFPIHVPPLRERREDIPRLAEHFLARAAEQNRCPHKGITDAAVALLVSYPWPGNVRQLQSVIERALLLSGGAPISEQHLPTELTRGFVPPEAGEAPKSLAYAQRLMVARALFESNWNYGKAAQHLGISTQALRQMAARMQLHPGERETV